MSNVNVNLSLGRNAFSKSKNFNQVFENTQEVDNTDGFINLLSVSGTKGTAIVPSIKAFCVYNMGDVPAEVQFTFLEWKINSNVDEANNLAADIGYPVIIKATAGGGVRGMRIKYMILEWAMNMRNLDKRNIGEKIKEGTGKKIQI